MTTRNQHHVWRYYLEEWQSEDGLILSSINGKIVPPTNPKNVMVERDFYKLPQLTKDDEVFLNAFVEATGAEELKQIHRNFVDVLVRVVRLNEIIQSSNKTSDEEKTNAQSLVIEFEEKLQGGIEQDALPILMELRRKRTDFVTRDKDAIKFFHYISHQYFRTKRLRQNTGEALSEMYPNHDFSRLGNIICHMAATNVGSTLFRDRREFDIVFLENGTDIGFVTGDQPVVNLLGTEDGSDPKEIIFYYPLSPYLSCLVTPKEYRICTAEVSVKITDELNDLIAWHSQRFLVAKSDRALRHVVSRSSSTQLPAYHILDALLTRA